MKNENNINCYLLQVNRNVGDRNEWSNGKSFVVVVVVVVVVCFLDVSSFSQLTASRGHIMRYYDFLFIHYYIKYRYKYDNYRPPVSNVKSKVQCKMFSDGSILMADADADVNYKVARV